MQPFQERVVEERKQLDEKIEKLADFINSSDIFPGLETNEKLRLHDQLGVMRRYSRILRERIEAYSDGE